MDVSFITLIKGLLPFHKRLAKRLAFLNALANMLDAMMEYIRTFRIYATGLANTNCQTIRLLKHLNDMFDNNLRRITIGESEDWGVVIGFEEELNYMLMGYESEYEGVIIASEIEQSSSGIFIIPENLNADLVRGEIKKYVLAGTKITIETN
jgi:hypothetical protein